MQIIKASIIKNMNESIACYYICWTFVFFSIVAKLNQFQQ